MNPIFKSIAHDLRIFNFLSLRWYVWWINYCCRRRKKEEDTSHNNNHISRTVESSGSGGGSNNSKSSSGHKFDLEANAFPPLPAHIAETTVSSASTTSAPSEQSDNHSNDESQQLNGENGLVKLFPSFLLFWSLKWIRIIVTCRICFSLAFTE